MAPTLAYWGLRGLTEPIRYLLHFKGVDFEDKRYTDRELWLSEKFNLGLDFPNLPYYIDGDVRLTQSLTILRHLARKYHLAGSTEDERVKLELVEQQILDFRMSFFRAIFSDNIAEEKEKLKKSVPDQLKLLATFLGDKKFLASDSISYVDFIAYDAFDFYELLLPAIYKDFPSIKSYMKRFENLPELQDYLKSPRYVRWPIAGPMAKFGGSGEEPKKIP